METIKIILRLEVLGLAPVKRIKYIKMVQDRLNQTDWIDGIVIPSQEPTRIWILNQPIIVTSEEVKEDFQNRQQEIEELIKEIA